jgi:inhibitor of cysteine peptidase
MSRVLSFFLTVAIILAALASCSTDEVNIFGYTNPDEPIEALCGSTFIITQVANPTTGYHWVFTEPIDSSYLELVGEWYIPLPNPEGKQGVGGHQQWEFRAVDPGATEISLAYIGPSVPTDTAWTAVFEVEVVCVAPYP